MSENRSAIVELSLHLGDFTVHEGLSTLDLLLIVKWLLCLCHFNLNLIKAPIEIEQI